MSNISIPQPYIAAVVQSAACGFDTQATLEKVAAWTETASEQKAQLVVFPEAFVGSYPYGVDFGTRIGLRTPEGREMFARFHHAAIEIPGPEVTELAAIAKEKACYLVIGVVERASGTLYSSTLYFSPNGQLIGRRRKLNSVGVERYVWGRGDGSDIIVAGTPIGNIGAIMGCENYMPPLRMAMYAKSMSLYCAPTTDDSDVWPCSMRTVAMEGRTFVLSACQVLRREDLPASYPLEEEAGTRDFLIRGGSCIVDPLGVVLAEPRYENECLLTAEIDMSKVARGKYDFDVVGHYARSDVFRLEVNETPQLAVDSVEQVMEPVPHIAARRE